MERLQSMVELQFTVVLIGGGTGRAIMEWTVTPVRKTAAGRGGVAEAKLAAGCAN